MLYGLTNSEYTGNYTDVRLLYFFYRANSFALVIATGYKGNMKYVLDFTLINLLAACLVLLLRIWYWMEKVHDLARICNISVFHVYFASTPLPRPPPLN